MPHDRSVSRTSHTLLLALFASMAGLSPPMSASAQGYGPPAYPPGYYGYDRPIYGPSPYNGYYTPYGPPPAGPGYGYDGYHLYSGPPGPPPPYPPPGYRSYDPGAASAAYPPAPPSAAMSGPPAAAYNPYGSRSSARQPAYAPRTGGETAGLDPPMASSRASWPAETRAASGQAAVFNGAVGKPPQLSRRMVQAAGAYLNYVERASEISGRFSSGSDVAKDLKIGVAYEPHQFEEGAIAYVALLSLQDPAFVSGVRSAWSGDERRAQAIASGLMADPTSILRVNGAQAAAARAGGALRRQGDRLLLAGLKVKQAAYDVQHASWSKANIVEPQSRLAGAKALSLSKSSLSREDGDKLLQKALAEPVPAASGSASPLVSRGLALAALTVMGRTGIEDEAASSLTVEDRGDSCLKMSKLNLFQCLAVAGPHYEDIFCLGQHAMIDTAQCIVTGSGVSRPLLTASAAGRLGRATSPAPAAYWASPDGPSDLGGAGR